jgi:AmmeMemoRadiSam system protein B/AmmeMemoRadiSam system protein A
MWGRDPGTPGVRPAAVAGRWYPSDPVHLTSQLEVMLEAADPWEGRGRLRALVAPHAGLMYSGPTAAYGYACVEPGRFDRVVVMAPSHRTPLRGAAVDPSTHYETPLGRMPVDRDAVEALAARDGFQSTAKPFQSEHAIEMQLPFLQLRLPEAKLVPVLVGELGGADFDVVAASMSPLLGERTLVVVSSDFVHYGRNYGFVPFTEDVPSRIRNLDRQAIDAIESHDFGRFQDVLERTGATICGRRPLGAFMLLAPRTWKSELRHYTTSGEITGDFSNSVSYVSLIFCEGTTEPERLAVEAEKLANERAPVPAVAPDVSVKAPAGQVSGGSETGAPSRTEAKDAAAPAASPIALGRDEQRTLLHLARRSLEALFAPEREPEVRRLLAEAEPRLREPAGVFVTLHRARDHRLRGCIGSIEPREPLVDAVFHNARAAAQRDPRFRPLRYEEMRDLEIEISVLGPLLLVHDPAEIEVGRDGLLIAKGSERGVLLPQVAVDLHWDRVEFLENLCRKAELRPNAWRSGAILHRFEALVFGESSLASPSD